MLLVWPQPWRGLVVLVTTRADGSAQASVVNAGVLANPIDGSPSVALVAQGRARKVANLRARPRATVVARAGWEWAAVEGAPPTRAETACRSRRP